MAENVLSNVIFFATPKANERCSPVVKADVANQDLNFFPAALSIWALLVRLTGRNRILLRGTMKQGRCDDQVSK